jgi:hypothetical protein
MGLYIIEHIVAQPCRLKNIGDADCAGAYDSQTLLKLEGYRLVSEKLQELLRSSPQTTVEDHSDLIDTQAKG